MSYRANNPLSGVRACVAGLSLLGMGQAAAESAFCDQQTGAFMARLDSELSTPLTQSQRAEVEVIALRSCTQDSPMSRAAPPEGFSDWFSYFMVTHTGDKPGNDRLRNFKR